MSILSMLVAEDRHNPAPPIPSGRKLSLDDILDDYEAAFVGEQETVIGRSYAIVYKDTAGKQSERLITVRAFTDSADEGVYLVNAYCHHRKAQRSFRTDRIVELINTDTGQIYDCAEAVAEWAGCHGHSFWKSVKSINETLICAVYAARIDLKMTAEERLVIYKWMQRRMKFDFDLSLAESYICNLRPTHDQFEAAYRYLLNRELEGDCMMLLDDIVNADNRVTEEEEALINSL